MNEKQLKKRIQQLRKYAPHKKEDIAKLNGKLLLLNNSTFSQPINHFRKKIVVFRRHEHRHLGRKTAYSLETHKHLNREKFSRTPTRKYA